MSNSHENTKNNCVKNEASSSQDGQVIVFLRKLPLGGIFDRKTDDFDSETCTLARLYDEILNIQKQLSAQKKNLLGVGKNESLHDVKYNHVAAKESLEEVMDFLSIKDASFDNFSKEKLMLRYAAWKGDSKAVKILLKKETDVNAVDANDIKPIHLAALGGRANMIDILLDKGANINDSDKFGRTPLHYATRNGELDVVKRLYNRGAGINVAENDGKKSIHTAAMKGYENLIDFFLSKGAKVNDVDNKGWTPLHYAANVGKLVAVKFLINKGANINAVESTSYHRKPIHLAAVGGHKDVIDFLLGEGAKVNDGDDEGWGPLHNAVVQGKLEAVEFLIEKGTDVNAAESTIQGRKPIHLAAYGGHQDVIDFLLSNGAKVNDADNEGWTPLHMAAFRGELRACKILVEKKADVNAVNKIGRKPIHLAAKEGHKDIIDFLLRKHAILNDTDNRRWTPLHYAAWEGKLLTVEFLLDEGADVHAVEIFKVKGDHRKIIELLLKRGAKVSEVSKEGWTPLHYAAGEGDLESVAFLLDKGADVNAVTSSGFHRKPIHIAAEYGHKNIIDFLIGKGASVNDFDNNGWTPLHYAAYKFELKAAKFLTDRGADVNAKSAISDGKSPIHLAAKGGSKRFIHFLLSNGAIVNDVDRDGWTPLHYAARYNWLDIAKYLIRNGANVNAVNSVRKTALDLAREVKHSAIVKYIVDSGKGKRERRSIESKDSTKDVNIVKLQQVDESNVQSHAELNSDLFHRETVPLEPISCKFVAESGNHGIGRNRHDFSGKKTEVALTGQSSDQVTTSPKSSAQDGVQNGHMRENVRPRLETLADKELPVNFGSSSAVHSSLINNIFGWQNSAGRLLVSKNVSTDEKSKAEISISQPSNVNGTILLLDLLIRKATGKNHASSAKFSSSIVEAQQYALNITAKFEEALEQAALKSDISMHRLNIDFVELQKEITRKVMTGRFDEISSLVKSYIEKACDGEAAGSGKLCSKKYHNFIVEIDNALDVILNQQ